MALARDDMLLARAAAFPHSRIDRRADGVAGARAAASFCASVSTRATCSTVWPLGDVTMFFGVPTMYVRLLERAGDTPRSRRCASTFRGSAALSAEVHRAFARPFRRADPRTLRRDRVRIRLRKPLRRSARCGQRRHALSGRARARSPHRNGAPLPPGEIGELLVSRSQRFCRLLERSPRQPAKRLSSTPAGRAGIAAAISRGTMRRCGVYRIVGRIKELIITGGFNVYPREVEDDARSVAGVRRLRGRRQTRSGPWRGAGGVRRSRRRRRWSGTAGRASRTACEFQSAQGNPRRRVACLATRWEKSTNPRCAAS